MTSDNSATTTDCKYLNYLSSEARSLMDKRASQAAFKDGDKNYQAIYLSKICKTIDKELAVAELAGIVNTLVTHGLVHSTLGHLNTLELHHSPKRHHASVAHVFLLIPTDRFAEAEKIAEGYSFPEGGIGDTSFLNVKLPRGQFYCNFCTSIAKTMVKGFDEDKEVKETIDHILRLMPDGTSLVSYRKCPFTTAIEYEAIFHNELLSDFEEVFIEHDSRYVEINEELKFVRLPVKIKYLARDGKTSIL